MTRPLYNHARRVFWMFWIVGNCSAHLGARAVQQWRDQDPQLTLILLSWNDFPEPECFGERWLDFPYHRESTAKTFEWSTRQDLAKLLAKLGYQTAV